MDIFIKASAGILVACLLCLFLSKQSKDFSLILAAAVCCTVSAAALNYLTPVVQFVKELSEIGNLDTEMFRILLKSVGIGLLSEFVCLVCTDAGNAALGKTIQIMASALILSMSVPLLTKLIELIEKILSAP